MPQVMTEMNQCRTFIGLGGNLGDPLARFIEVRQALDQHDRINVIACSPLYQTAPVGGPVGQNDYLNAVLELSTSLSPADLLACCFEFERLGGRQRGERWGPRTLDVDLLLIGSLVCSTPQLTLPHPRLHLRAFVLQPLCDLAPALRHPVYNRTITEMLHSLPAKAGEIQSRGIW